MKFTQSITRIGIYGLFLACLTALLPVWAAPAGGSEIRVGVYNNAPKIFLDGDLPSGILIDVLRAIARAEQWQLRYVPCEWQACLDALRRGQIDLMPDVAFNPERDAIFDFHTTPALYSWSQLYARSDANIASVFDLRGKRVALLEGGVQAEAFKSMMSGFGLPVTVVPVQSLDGVFAAVKNAEADAGIVNNLYGEFNAVKAGLVETPIVFQPARLFYATAEGQHRELLHAVDQHLSAWQADPKSVYFEILRKWRGQADMAATPQWIWTALTVVGMLALVAVVAGGALARQVKTQSRQAHAEHAHAQAILDALPDLLFEIGQDGTYYDYHSPRTDLLAAPREQLIGNTVQQILPAEAAKTVLDAVEVANQQGFSSGQVIQLKLPQGEHWFELSVAKKAVSADSAPRFIVLSRDVSERRASEVALRDSEQTYRALFDASPVPFLMYDGEQNIRQVNRAFVQCFGYAPEDITTLEQWRTKAYPDADYRQWVIERWRANLARSVHDGSPFEPLILQIQARSGERRTVLASAVATTGPLHGLHLAMLYDITDTTRAETRLHRIQTMMERTEHMARTASWEWGVDANVVTWSPEMFRIFGRDPALGIPNLEGQTELYTAESVQKLFAAVQRAVAEGLAYELELDTVQPDGEVRPCRVKGYPERDSTGRVVRLAGLLQDITDRRHEEERNRLAISVFAHAREGIVITDAQATILDSNASFSRITGYTTDELRGQNPRILKSARQSPGFYQAMWADLTRVGFWEGELWNLRKNGELFAEHLTISAVQDGAGTVQNYVGIVMDVTADHEHRSQLEHVAYHDRLTGLPNRNLLADRLQLAMLQCTRHDQALAVVYLDLDGFKAINDTHGHDVGDCMLVEIAQRMKSVLRESDTLARIGGDEFVAVLADLSGLHDCKPVLGRLLHSAAEPVLINGLSLRVSASLGVTIYPDDRGDADQLLRHADQAMYLAKQAGRNQYHFFDVENAAAVQTQRESLEHMRQALDRREFVLYYQPKVNIKTGSVLGAEALIRWQHPEQGLLPPASFLPIIEGHVLSVDMGDWVINTALDQLSAWCAAGLSLVVSVNVGAGHLQHPDFVPRLAQALAAHPDVRPEQLELEILETSALEDVAQVSERMHACLALGVSFALDDFGTGYSSLTYLKRLPAAMLKIDQSFVRDMLTDVDDLAIVRGVIGLAGVFRRDVIAEGVETAAHGTQLLALGCELVQGYGIARPMPAEHFLPWARAWQVEATWTA